MYRNELLRHHDILQFRAHSEEILFGYFCLYAAMMMCFANAIDVLQAALTFAGVSTSLRGSAWGEANAAYQANLGSAGDATKYRSVFLRNFALSIFVSKVGMPMLVHREFAATFLTVLPSVKTHTRSIRSAGTSSFAQTPK